VNGTIEWWMDGKCKALLQRAISCGKRIDYLAHFLTCVFETHEVTQCDVMQKG
jgi:hypothetical protein